MYRPWIALLVGVLLAGAAVGVGPALAGPAATDTGVTTGGATAGWGTAVSGEPGADDWAAADAGSIPPAGVVAGQGRGLTAASYTIEVFANGSARWTVGYTRPLPNRSDVRQFRDYAAAFTGGETPLFTDFRERATGLVETGTNATGRGMTVGGFDRRARVVQRPETTGIVEMSFIWTNFTVADGDRRVVGDAFEGGLYVGPNQSLSVAAGPELAIESATPPPDARTNETGNGTVAVTWFGERTFADRHPRVVLEPRASARARGFVLPGDSPAPWIAGTLLAALGLGAALVRRSGDAGESRDDGAGGVATAPHESAAAEGSVPEEPTPERATPEGSSSAGSAPVDSMPADPTSADRMSDRAEDTKPSGATLDEPLRTDEDRVVALLEANGGRMRQVRIVEETGWSKSKVSTLLSEMEETDTLGRLRLGRENVVSLAGHEPDAAGSPFDDES
ncbi:hypothetical protein BRC90_05625 [Halobacteriales archaeon QS_4_69_34]|nr:MAG: hypothetical protein BRC90_05625 [Halobacteriales archaeon QS_4_69_34]